MAIIAEWSKKYSKHIGILVFLLCCITMPAQEEVRIGGGQTGKEQAEFDALFFKASRLYILEEYDQALEAYLLCEKKDPNNATVQYELCRLYERKGDFQTAISKIESAISLDGENPYLWEKALDLQEKANLTGSALTAVAKLVELRPEQASYKLKMAELQLKNGEPQLALKTLEEFEVQHGLTPEITEEKKRIRLSLNDISGAEAELRALIESDPANNNNYGNLAQFLEANDRPKEAKQIYLSMLERDAEDPRVHLSLADLYKRENKIDSSQSHLIFAMGSPRLEVDQKVAVLLSVYQVTQSDQRLLPFAHTLLDTAYKVNADDPKFLAMYADYAYREGQYEVARNNWNKALNLPGGEKWEIRQRVMEADLFMRHWEGLKIDADQTIERYPNQPAPYLMKALAHNNLKEYQEAIYALEDGQMFVLDNPQLSIDFELLLADNFDYLGKVKEAEIHYQNALDIAGNAHPLALNNYAYFLANKNMKLDEALEMTEKSNMLQPNNPTFLDTWAWVLYSKKDYVKALEIVQKAIDLGGDKIPDILEHKGDILFAMGNSAEALGLWEAALTLNPENKSLRTKIEKHKK